MKKNLIKKILCVAMSVTLLSTTNVAAATTLASIAFSKNATALEPEKRDASMASYNAVKIGDTRNSASVAASIAKGYYQYNTNNSYSKDGLKVDRSVVNILFVANCWSDGNHSHTA